MPEAEEVFPLGGRQGETVGLELRGGTLSGVRLAAATLNPLTGNADHAREDRERRAWDWRAIGAADLDLESMRPLVTSAYPELREPADPGAAPTKAIAPVVFNGRIDPRGRKRSIRDRDDAGPAGADQSGSLRIRLGPRRRPSSPGQERRGDRQCRRYEHRPAGSPRPATADDRHRPIRRSTLTIPGSTNEITLAIRDLENRGGIGFPYRIVVEPLLPDFELLANESQISVPRGGTASMGVTVLRKGYSGPITVTVADPPAGLSVRPGTIAAGQTTGALTLTASADASFAAAPLKLVGRGSGPEGPFERLATKPIVYAQQNNVPMYSIEHFGLVAAPALPLPVTLETPSAPIEIPHGYSATIPVKIVRTKGADAALEITALPLPAGLAVPKASIAAKAAEGKVTVNAAVAAPLGTTTLVLQAKGKLGGADRVIDLPAVTLTVVPPASLELAAPSLEIKPGATLELKGKIVRKGSFDAPVTVKINGLPAGLKADPVTVAGKDSSFVVKVIAEAKAAAATADTRIAMAFQVEKKDYSVPPTPFAVKVIAVQVSVYRLSVSQLSVVSGQLCDQRRLCSGDSQHAPRDPLLGLWLLRDCHRRGRAGSRG